jgi:hypothetical protein
MGQPRGRKACTRVAADARRRSRAGALGDRPGPRFSSRVRRPAVPVATVAALRARGFVVRALRFPPSQHPSRGLKGGSVSTRARPRRRLVSSARTSITAISCPCIRRDVVSGSLPHLRHARGVDTSPSRRSRTPPHEPRWVGRSCAAWDVGRREDRLVALIRRSYRPPSRGHVRSWGWQQVAATRRSGKPRA